MSWGQRFIPTHATLRARLAPPRGTDVNYRVRSQGHCGGKNPTAPLTHVKCFSWLAPEAEGDHTPVPVVDQQLSVVADVSERALDILWGSKDTSSGAVRVQQCVYGDI